MVKSTMTGTVTSSDRGGTAAAMALNEQTAEEHSTLKYEHFREVASRNTTQKTKCEPTEVV